MRSSRRPIQHEIERFRSDPSSMRNATFVIITVTMMVVFVGSLVIWIFDKRDFPDFGTAFWFVLQTVTTVGYGDVTPESALGRVVGGLVMVVGIAFITIVTATITSTFVEAAQRRRTEQSLSAAQESTDRFDARFQEVVGRLEAIEASLARLEAAGGRVAAVPSEAPSSGTDPVA